MLSVLKCNKQGGISRLTVINRDMPSTVVDIQ